MHVLQHASAADALLVLPASDRDIAGATLQVAGDRTDISAGFCRGSAKVLQGFCKGSAGFCRVLQGSAGFCKGSAASRGTSSADGRGRAERSATDYAYSILRNN